VDAKTVPEIPRRTKITGLKQHKEAKITGADVSFNTSFTFLFMPLYYMVVIDIQLRALLNKAYKPFGIIKLNPNLISFVGFMFGIAAFALVLVDYKIVALLLFLINRILDGIDGTVARRQHKETEFGKILDLYFDFIIYALIPIGVAIHTGKKEDLIVCCFLITSFYINAGTQTTAGSPREQSLKRKNFILIEGFETIVFIVFILLFPNLFFITSLIFAGLVFCTSLIRLIKLSSI
jgi:phosphatidylglycerophosphate synthase